MKETCHKYEYNVDLNRDTAPAAVTHIVGRNKRVLEIGSGPGSITKLLRLTSNCRVTALELDWEAIEKVAPYCEVVMRVDLNSNEWPGLLDGFEQFDVVVAADVLEHLYDPWTTLRRMTSFITPQGYLVVSLPHVGHAGVLSCLINSDFEYRNWGLLDSTHIRFFGLRNIEALFAQARLKIVEVKYVIKPPEETEFAASWSKLSANMRSTLISAPYSEVYQVVVKAVPLHYPENGVALIPAKHECRRTLRTAPSLWKNRIGRRLSPKLKQHIRRSLKTFGIDQ